MTDYTIVEPGFEFFDPPTKDNYLEFLERCTRVCYKSEEHIKLGSAEKLMAKVVKEYEHFSVTEHANIIIRMDTDPRAAMDTRFRNLNPLLRTSWQDGNHLIVSGNVRMWMELFKRSQFLSEFVWLQVEAALHEKMPFFFDKAPMIKLIDRIQVLDENPVTNKDNLSIEEMHKHMTLTYKLVGDRSMSHQLVRHRLCAFSQESQRYCNYGKKGFQFVIPPSATEEQEPVTFREMFIGDAVEAYEKYLWWIKQGLKPEDARALLPNCTKTEVVTTATLSNWQHMFDHRANNPKAQWQIRGIMLDIQEHARTLLPGVFKEC
jgi:thymidylate synthase (FAD)